MTDSDVMLRAYEACRKDNESTVFGSSRHLAMVLKMSRSDMDMAYADYVEERMDDFEDMHEREDGWSDWVHPQPGYRMKCCDCGLVHEMEFQLVRQDQIEGLTDDLRQPGETQKKAVVFRARRTPTNKDTTK